MVQVHHDEGVTNRIDPESYANTRGGIGEALTGERIGQPLSATYARKVEIDPQTGRDEPEGQGEALGRDMVRGLCPRRRN